MKNRIIVSVITLYLASCSVWSPTFPDAGHIHDHEHDHEHGHGEKGSSVGNPGDPNNVSRTIVLQMTFNRFKPSKINVKRGETIKFIFKNISEKKHEFMIGTMRELKEHAKMMRKHPNMVHTEPNQVTVNSGENGELTWKFTEVGTIPFACPKHGHFKGMRGEIKVTDK